MTKICIVTSTYNSKITNRIKLLAQSELKKNGIKCSPSAMDGINNIKEDLFNLKRIFCN